MPTVLERISDLPLPLRHLPSLLLLIGTFGLEQAYNLVHWEIAEFVGLGAEHGDLVLGVSRHTVRVGRGVASIRSATRARCCTHMTLSMSPL
ncbi:MULTISPECIES: hypothetical protein [unclassified Corynebacterium]|uniref:hypothetical protein n=1 Tax=unclassified Corynebacterium TaxID=2624378 RepID=UPI00210D4559|nr:MULTISPECIES: hypothetical protein [unclassified Corynebacterium]MCQ4612725.1 hypothetical protein [Corynebacterium sp. CCUG 51687]